MTPHLRYFPELNFAATATEINEYVCRFDLYEVFSWKRVDGEHIGTPLFKPKGNRPPCENTSDISEAVSYVTGYIKWDGCSDWTFNQEENFCFHFCGQEEIKSLALAMEECWLWAGELIEKWDAD